MILVNRMNYIFIILSLISSICFAEIKNESEIGVLILSGETASRTENLKHSSIFSFVENEFTVKGNYLHLSNDSQDKELWEILFRAESFVNSNVSWFLGKSLEGREYKNNTDIGIKHKSDHFTNEIGHRTTIEESGTTNFLRLYSEVKSKQFKFWVEALYDEKIYINYEPSINFFLSDKLSLKISYLSKFKKDRRSDGIYTTALIAKY